MRRNKHFLTGVCLVVGFIILATAAFANYDNANGYALYKDALKRLIYETNFEGEIKMSLLYNGEVVQSENMETMYDYYGDVTQYTRQFKGDGTTISEEWISNGVGYTRRDPNLFGNEWSAYTSYGKGYNSALYENESEREMAGKVIRFMELFTDTFVGDLKNNFVFVGGEGRNYQIHLQGPQVPELINAGFSMLYASMVNDRSDRSDPSFVTTSWDFEMSRDAEEIDRFNELYEVGYEYLEVRGYVGVYVIKSDQSFVYYPTYDEYLEAESRGGMGMGMSMEDIILGIGGDPKLEKASCYITLDDEGRLIYNRLAGTLSGVDENGVENTVELIIEMNFENYGGVKIELPEMPSDLRVPSAVSAFRGDIKVETAEAE